MSLHGSAPDRTLELKGEVDTYSHPDPKLCSINDHLEMKF